MIQASLVLEEQGGSVSSIPPGIHKEIIFQGVILEGDWIDIKYQSAQGQVIRKRLFKPTGSMQFPIKVDGVERLETPEESLKREQMRNLGILSTAMKAAMPLDLFNAFKAKDYNEFVAKAAVEVNKFKGAKVNLKVVGKQVKDKVSGKVNIYSDIQNYPGFAEAFVEGVEPTLVFSKKELDALEIKAPAQPKSEDLGI